MSLKKIILLILSFTMISTVTSFSSNIDNHKKSELMDLAFKLKRNQFLFIRTVDNDIIKGKFRYIKDDSLFIRNRKGIFTLPFTDVDSLWARKSSSTQFALAGGSVGLLTGLAIGTYFRRDITIFHGPGEVHNERLVIGAALGAVIGAAIGQGIGLAATRKHLYYPLPLSDSIGSESRVNPMMSPTLTASCPAQTESEIKNDEFDKNFLNRMQFLIGPDEKGGLYMSATFSF